MPKGIIIFFQLTIIRELRLSYQCLTYSVLMMYLYIIIFMNYKVLINNYLQYNYE